MASRVPLLVGGLLLAGVAAGAVVFIVTQNPARRLSAALHDLRSAKQTAEREAIRERIAAIPADPSLTPVLIEALNDRSEEVQEAASDELRRIGMPAKELLAAYVGPNRRLRAFAERTLDSLGPGDEAQVPGFIEALDDANEAVKQRAIVALGSIGAASKPAVPKLIMLLREGDAIAAANAAEALGRIGPAAAEAAPALLAIVRDGSRVTVVAPAVTALGGIGEPAKESIPVLLASLPQSSVKGAIIASLLKLQVAPEQFEPHLKELEGSLGDAALNSEDFASAVKLLGALGEKSRPLLPDLFRNAPTHTTGDVVEAMKRIDPTAGALLEAVCAIFDAPEDAKTKAQEGSLKVNGRSILFVPYRMNWNDAREWCEARGGRLASIRDPEEQRAVIEYARKFERRRVYFGASDRRQEGRFQWEDDSPWGYTHWKSGEPNDHGGNEDNGEIYLDEDGIWNDAGGWDGQAFLIQWTD